MEFFEKVDQSYIYNLKQFGLYNYCSKAIVNLYNIDKNNYLCCLQAISGFKDFENKRITRIPSDILELIGEKIIIILKI